MATTTEENSVVPFTYIWAIENCPALLTPCLVRSPNFIMDDTKSHWCLITAEENGLIMYFLQRQNDDGPEIVENVFEISLLDTKGHPLITETFQRAFRKGDNRGSRTFARIHDVFNLRRATFLTNETLTFRCRISRSHFEIFRINLCYARTRLAIQRTSFVWVIRDFVFLEVGQGVSKLVMVTENSSLLVTLLLAEVNGEDQVTLNIALNASFRFNVKISVLDFLGKVCLTIFPNGNQNAHERFNLIGRNFLMTNKDIYLPLDTLTLRCEFIIGTGIEHNEIEHYRYFPNQ